MPEPRPQRSSQNPYFRPVMFGLAVGSGSFLIARYAFRLDVDPSLVLAAFFGVAVAVFLKQKPN